MKTALYFHSRRNFKDTSTWSKEQMPSDATITKVAQAARFGGAEGFAVVRNFGTKDQETLVFRWFK